MAFYGIHLNQHSNGLISFTHSMIVGAHMKQVIWSTFITTFVDGLFFLNR